MNPTLKPILHPTFSELVTAVTNGDLATLQRFDVKKIMAEKYSKGPFLIKEVPDDKTDAAADSKDDFDKDISADTRSKYVRNDEFSEPRPYIPAKSNPQRDGTGVESYFDKMIKYNYNNLTREYYFDLEQMLGEHLLRLIVLACVYADKTIADQMFNHLFAQSHELYPQNRSSVEIHRDLQLFLQNPHWIRYLPEDSDIASNPEQKTISQKKTIVQVVLAIMRSAIIGSSYSVEYKDHLIRFIFPNTVLKQLYARKTSLKDLFCLAFRLENIELLETLVVHYDIPIDQPWDEKLSALDYTISVLLQEDTFIPHNRSKPENLARRRRHITFIEKLLELGAVPSEDTITKLRQLQSAASVGAIPFATYTILTLIDARENADDYLAQVNQSKDIRDPRRINQNNELLRKTLARVPDFALRYFLHKGLFANVAKQTDNLSSELQYLYAYVIRHGLSGSFDYALIPIQIVARVIKTLGHQHSNQFFLYEGRNYSLIQHLLTTRFDGQTATYDPVRNEPPRSPAEIEDSFCELVKLLASWGADLTKKYIHLATAAGGSFTSTPYEDVAANLPQFKKLLVEIENCEHLQEIRNCSTDGAGNLSNIAATAAGQALVTQYIFGMQLAKDQQNKWGFHPGVDFSFLPKFVTLFLDAQKNAVIQNWQMAYPEGCKLLMTERTQTDGLDDDIVALQSLSKGSPWVKQAAEEKEKQSLVVVLTLFSAVFKAGHKQGVEDAWDGLYDDSVSNSSAPPKPGWGGK